MSGFASAMFGETARQRHSAPLRTFARQKNTASSQLTQATHTCECFFQPVCLGIGTISISSLKPAFQSTHICWYL
jgi:hypothetical protein